MVEMFITQWMSPNWPMLRIRLEEKLEQEDFFKHAQMFGAKLVPPRMPHEMSELSGPTLVKSPWTIVEETERSYWAEFLEFRLALNSAPS